MIFESQEMLDPKQIQRQENHYSQGDYQYCSTTAEKPQQTTNQEGNNIGEGAFSRLFERQYTAVLYYRWDPLGGNKIPVLLEGSVIFI